MNSGQDCILVQRRNRLCTTCSVNRVRILFPFTQICWPKGQESCRCQREWCPRGMHSLPSQASAPHANPHLRRSEQSDIMPTPYYQSSRQFAMASWSLLQQPPQSSSPQYPNSTDSQISQSSSMFLYNQHTTLTTLRLPPFETLALHFYNPKHYKRHKILH